MKKKILVDSSCCMMSIDNLAEGIEFAKAPLKIMVGDKEFVDDENLDVDHMIDEMYAYPGKTSSACPSPEEYAAHFREADECYVVTIISTLSGSYNAALVAKQMVQEEFPDKKIYVLDSWSAGMQLTLMVQKLHELIASGLPFEEVCRQSDEYAKNHTKLVAVLYSIENLVKNGRVPKIVGMAASLLNLHLIVNVSEDGQIVPIAKSRNRKKGAGLVLAEMEEKGYKGGKVIISHCQNPAGVDLIKDTVTAKYPNAEFESMPTRGLCSYYAERGGLMIGYEVN